MPSSLKPLPQSSRLLLAPELGHLGFRRFLPHPLLQPWVQCYWTARQHLAGGSCSERLYPDGGSSLTFELAGANAGQATFQCSRQLERREFQGQIDSVGIHFHPGGAAQLLGLPLGSLGAQALSATEVGAFGIERLCDRLQAVAETPLRMTILEDWLLENAGRQQAQAGLVQQTLPVLIQGKLDMTEVEQLYGVSRRKLERVFRDEAGISPGKLRTLIRVKQARYLIKTRHELTLTEIAHQCGYYDQAHFNRQFRQVTQQKPGDYRLRQLHSTK